jgi:DNA-binding IclR family transcriptional regulator
MAQNRPLSARDLAADPDAAPPAEEKTERGGIQSIERAFAILEEIARDRSGISLAALSKRLGLHSSTAFHLVQTMVGLGYVRQMQDSRRYRIGRPIFALASACLDDIELTTLATPVLEALSTATGETAHFGVRSGGGEVVVVAKTPGAGAFQLTDRVGVVRPAHATALGKALLAALPPARFERYLAQAKLTPLSPKTITDPEWLRREIERIREDGIAFDDGELDAEIRCLAAAVHDFTGTAIGAIGISGPLWRLSLPVLQRHGEAVKNAAASLAAAIGAPK